MTTAKLDNSRVSKVLGRTVSYPKHYDPTILVSEPRQNNRAHLNISDNALPFYGVDVWNAYEVSTLTTKGLPVAGVMKILYPCDSKYIVESKSLKLYLNSYNMTSAADSPEGSIEYIRYNTSKDLSKLLETDVHVKILTDKEASANPLDAPTRKLYETLEELPDAKKLYIHTYTETPALLDVINTVSEPAARFFHTSLLKSNCRVTSQPDWGDCYIYVKSKARIDRMSLLRYLISFRDECHFHEEICETIYKRLYDILDPEELCVTCLYARRGGIDINPIRATSKQLLIRNLTDINKPHAKTSKQ